MARQPDGARTSEVWTIPNIISMVRLAGVPLFLWLVIGPEADVWALVVLMISGFTDWLDGYLARRLNQMSKLGEILDPVADRLYILAAVIGLLYRDIIPLWVAVLLPARDLFLWCLVPFLRTRGYSALPVHYLGKAATAALLYSFPMLFLGDGDGPVATLVGGVRLGVRDLGDRPLLVGRAALCLAGAQADGRPRPARPEPHGRLRCRKALLLRDSRRRPRWACSTT